MFPEIYPFVMLAAMVSGCLLLRVMQSKLTLTTEQRLAVGIAAFCGAMLGAKLPFAISDIEGLLDGTTWFKNGKTIMCGMVGAYLAVEVTKWTLGIHTKTGDSFVVPVAVTVAIGRLGCLSAGCCYGTESNVAWALRCAATDESLRHPTQIYESLFHLTLAAIMFAMMRRQIWKGQLAKFYILSYLGYRFLTEFIRPEEHMSFEITWYQWFAIVTAPLFIGLWIWDSRQLAKNPQAPEEQLSSTNEH